MISPLLLANEFDFILRQHERHRRADREDLSLIRADDKFADRGLDIELVVRATRNVLTITTPGMALFPFSPTSRTCTSSGQIQPLKRSPGF